MDVLLTARPNVFKAAFGQIIALIFTVLCGFYLINSQFMSVLGYLFIIYAVILFIGIYLYYSNMVLTIDKEKTIFKTGILNKRVIEVKHVDVRNIQIFQGIFQRIFDIGTVSIFSAGTNTAEINIKGVHEYIQIKDLLNNERKKIEKKSNEDIPKNTGNDATDQIKKLSDLKDQGILTEEEFQKKKEDLLTKI